MSQQPPRVLGISTRTAPGGERLTTREAHIRKMLERNARSIQMRDRSKRGWETRKKNMQEVLTQI